MDEFQHEQARMLREIRNTAAYHILSVAAEYRQLNAQREALVSLIERIPAEQRTAEEAALLTQHEQIEGFRARSNELESATEAAQTLEDLRAIEISF